MKKDQTPQERRRSLIYKCIVVVAAIIALIFVARYFPAATSALHSMSDRAVSGSPIRFEISDTEAKRELGLGGRATIPDNYAMVFVFPNKDRYGFWMKGMEQPIDMIWLSDSGSILGIQNSIATSTYPAVFYPPQPVRYVLEARAGFAHDKGLSVGDHFPDLPVLPTVLK